MEGPWLVIFCVALRCAAFRFPFSGFFFVEEERGERTNPGIDFALKARHERRDVVLDDARQSRLVADLAHPARQLRVPNERVAADHFAVRRGPVDEVVGLPEVELAPVRLGRIPLETDKKPPVSRVFWKPKKNYSQGLFSVFLLSHVLF